MSTFTVDFVARGEDPNTWKLVLVEQGPWPESEVAERLKQLQSRLYDCLDAVIDGQVATQFPESFGKRITIRIDGYSLPEGEVHNFFSTFSSQVLQVPDYASAIANMRSVTGIAFELSLDDLPSP